VGNTLGAPLIAFEYGLLIYVGSPALVAAVGVVAVWVRRRKI
jgi:Flp pilus assembly pilin Flp